MRYRSRNNLKQLDQNRVIFCAIFAVMMLGWIAGAFYADYRADGAQIIGEIIEGLYFNRLNTNASLINTLSKYLRIIAILWISGFFTAGFAVIVSMLFVRSFAYSFTMCAFISHYGLYGLVMAFKTYVFQNIFLIGAMVFLSFFGLKSIIKKIGDIKQDRVLQGFVLIIGVLCAIIASLIETYITPILLS